MEQTDSESEEEVERGQSNDQGEAGGEALVQARTAWMEELGADIAGLENPGEVQEAGPGEVLQEDRHKRNNAAAAALEEPEGEDRGVNGGDEGRDDAEEAASPERDSHSQEIARAVARWREAGGGGEEQQEEVQALAEAEVEEEGEGAEEQEGVGGGEEYGELADRISPEVPGSRVTHPGEETGDGWHFIDQLGSMECYLSRFTTLQDVPGPFQAAWTMAWATVLQREAAAETDLARERALKWICFLSQGLLRTPRRGKRAGRGAVAKRFRAAVLGDWGSLVTMWPGQRRGTGGGRWE